MYDGVYQVLRLTANGPVGNITRGINTYVYTFYILNLYGVFTYITTSIIMNCNIYVHIYVYMSIGQENVVEYGPLIASVLLRIRLELCVLESFLYEAVLPFIQKKGLSWVLPLHETVGTEYIDIDVYLYGI